MKKRHLAINIPLVLFLLDVFCSVFVETIALLIKKKA